MNHPNPHSYGWRSRLIRTPRASLRKERKSADTKTAADWILETRADIDYETLLADKIMVENTRQFRWLVYVKDGIEAWFAGRNDVFVAGDLAWLPDANKDTPRLVPDVMVVLGRPPHDRSSYKQWEEQDIPPQVVFEILSPSNTAKEMERKRELYEKYRVEEFYLFDPLVDELTGYLRGTKGTLDKIPGMDGWISPRLNLTFRLEETGFRLYSPLGEPILMAKELVLARQQAEMEKLAEQQARLQAELELQELRNELEDLRKKTENK